MHRRKRDEIVPDAPLAPTKALKRQVSSSVGESTREAGDTGVSSGGADQPLASDTAPVAQPSPGAGADKQPDGAAGEGGAARDQTLEFGVAPLAPEVAQTAEVSGASPSEAVPVSGPSPRLEEESQQQDPDVAPSGSAPATSEHGGGGQQQRSPREGDERAEAARGNQDVIHLDSPEREVPSTAQPTPEEATTGALERREEPAPT